MPDSLQVTDQMAEAVAVAPRVKLADIQASIKAEYSSTASKMFSGCPVVDELDTLSVCILVLRNGFTVVGKSAPASAENFNEDLGRKLAREDAIRQIWPLMGFALKEKLHEGKS